jgi:sec-independent protein translocase protein TatB
MFDLAWSELAIIGVVALVVVGPKDLPKLMRSAGRMASQARKVADEFRGQMNEALREAELDDLKSSISEIKSLNPTNMIRDELTKLAEPVKTVADDVNREWQQVESQVASTASDVSGAVEAQPHTVADATVDVPVSDLPVLEGAPSFEPEPFKPETVVATAPIAPVDQTALPLDIAPAAEPVLAHHDSTETAPDKKA